MGSRDRVGEPGKEMLSWEEGTNPVGSVAMMQSLGFILKTVKTTGRPQTLMRGSLSQLEEVIVGPDCRPA